MVAEISSDVETMVRHARAMAIWRLQSRKQRGTVPKGVLHPYETLEDELDGEDETKTSFSIPELDALFAGSEREIAELEKRYRL